MLILNCFFGHEWRIIKLPSFSFDFLLSNKMFIGQIFRITREESKCSDWMLSLYNKFVLFWDVLNCLLKVNHSFEPSSSHYHKIFDLFYYFRNRLADQKQVVSLNIQNIQTIRFSSKNVHSVKVLARRKSFDRHKDQKQCLLILRSHRMWKGIWTHILFYFTFYSTERVWIFFSRWLYLQLIHIYRSGGAVV